MNAAKSNWNITSQNNFFKMICMMIIGALLMATGEGCIKKNIAKKPYNDLDEAIRRSADYLMNKTGKDGMFEYSINMNPAVNVKKKYNILRHAGAIYAMTMYYERHPDNNLRSAIKRAGNYLKNEAILPIPGEDHLKAVWSRPEVNGSDTLLQAKLGGTGLGLVALISIENMSPGFMPLSDLQALGRFIVYMQKKNGSFYSKYIPSMGGKQDRWQSLYYPGEAALGLLMLYEKDPSPVWLESAYRTLEHLARKRRHRLNVPHDHWALIATEKILSLKNTGDVAISRELLVNHAVQIARAMIRGQIDDPQQPTIDGGFDYNGRTSPTATRLEGLLSALSFLPLDSDIRKDIEASAPRGISFLVRAQVKEGTFSGAMPCAVWLGKENKNNGRLSNRRATEVRIDYVQHAMCAMMKYQEKITFPGNSK